MPQVLTEMLRVIRMSQDRKLGGMAATYRPVGITCPSDCPLLKIPPGKKRPPCYAKRGHVNLVQRRTAGQTDTLDNAAGIDMIRHHVSGDVFANDELDVPYVESILAFHQEHRSCSGALYSHRIADWNAAGITPDQVPKNLQVLASVDSRAERDRARALGWRTARTIDHPGKAEKGEALCPYDLHKHKKTKPVPVTCRSCKLCWRANGPDIAFVKF